MKRKICILLSIVLLLTVGLTGCKNRVDETAATTEATTEQEVQTEQETSTEQETLTEEDLKTAQGTTYTWEEITVTIPDAWEGKYVVKEYEGGFGFLQKASNDIEEGMGYLYGFFREDRMVCAHPGATHIAYTADTMYYMAEPTDVTCVVEDQSIVDEYSKLCEAKEQLAASLQIDKEGVRYDAREFIYPMSETLLLDETDLFTYNSNDLRIGRNEIYARHGKTFKDITLQDYFNACSWYEPVGPDIGDKDLSETEKKNVELIKEQEEVLAKKKPYPQKVSYGETLHIPFINEATESEVCCKIAKTTPDSDEYEAIITVDGKDFSLADFDVFLEIPETEHYYITDISPYFDGLEIAILDYGYSDYSMTYFFTYSDTLHCIGSVTGIPFIDISGYDGFANEGGVIGTERTNLIMTAGAYHNWWYNYNDGKLEDQSIDMFCDMIPGEAHELLIDLPVYYTRDETSDTFVMPAQKEVFFTGTDDKEWMRIKDGSGKEGYIHINEMNITNVNMDANDVFTGLYFAG
ncbi:MAG: YARHG domain-containing protein [Clostridia bacterium]|nr:YARHG domain-containing protein [Clostridia bacterium]